jgi:hypothetical protein
MIDMDRYLTALQIRSAPIVSVHISFGSARILPSETERGQDIRAPSGCSILLRREKGEERRTSALRPGVAVALRLGARALARRAAPQARRPHSQARVLPQG